MTELKDRIQAGQLRRKFEGHPAPARIAGLMSDEELVDRYKMFTDAALAHQQSKTRVVTKLVEPIQPLTSLYKKALETL